MQPNSPVCDFCERPADRLTRHECEPFEVEGVIIPGPWRACPECQAFIEAGDRDGLWRHAFSRRMADPEGQRRPSAVIQAWVLAEQQGFWAHRQQRNR